MTAQLDEVFVAEKYKFSQRRFNAATATVFMHIPKTSGTALTQELRRALAPSRPIWCFDGVLYGAFSDFDTFAPGMRRSFCRDADDLPEDRDFVSGHVALSTILHPVSLRQLCHGTA